MHIVIEIPDKLYKSILNMEVGICRNTLIKAITLGTPLPKGHGDLIDAREYENSIRKHYFDNSTVIRCTEIALDNAPTIIPAEKE